MRIAITIDGVEVFATDVYPETRTMTPPVESAYPEGLAPPPSVLRAAEAIGAESAGPAPPELAEEADVAAPETVELVEAVSATGYRDTVTTTLDGGKAPVAEPRVRQESDRSSK